MTLFTALPEDSPPALLLEEEEEEEEGVAEEVEEGGMGVSLRDILKLDDTPPGTPVSGARGEAVLAGLLRGLRERQPKVLPPHIARARQLSEGQSSVFTALSTQHDSALCDATGDGTSSQTSSPSGSLPPQLTPPQQIIPTLPAPPARSRAFALPPGTAPPIIPTAPQGTTAPTAATAPLTAPLVVPVLQPQPPILPQQPRRSVTLAPGGVEVLTQQVRSRQGAVPPVVPQLQVPSQATQQVERKRQLSDSAACTNAYSLFIARELEQGDGGAARWPRPHTTQARTRKGALLQRLRYAADKWAAMSDDQRAPFIFEASRNAEVVAPILQPPTLAPPQRKTQSHSPLTAPVL